MNTLVLTVSGFFIAVVVAFFWGSARAGKKIAEKRANETIKASQNFEENNSMPFVDNPATFLCYDESEYPALPKNDKTTGGKTE